MNTALQSALSGQPDAGTATPLSLSEYRGATMAAQFTDPQAEFRALTTGCAVYDLGFRAKISATGNDRVRWLNGMLTNNIRDLPLGHGVYAFLLNPQGHILGDMYAYNRGDSLLIDTDRSQVEKILATFDHYIIMDDVELSDLSDDLTSIGVGGPKSQDVLRAVGIQMPDQERLQVFEITCDCDCGCVECTIVRTDAPFESYEIWLSPSHVKALWERLFAAAATPVGSKALEMQRIVTGMPLYGVDIRERDLPQETEQARALNFSKGCYIGQEIVERIRSRGSVHRSFTGFVSRGARQTAAGSKVFFGEKEVGEVTSTALLQRSDAVSTVALGYIRREYAAASDNAPVEVTIGGAKASVVRLPFSEQIFFHLDDELNEVRAPAAS